MTMKLIKEANKKIYKGKITKIKKLKIMFLK